MKDNFYSRFVNLSKILLPIAALALLSTLFLFARVNDGTPVISLEKLEEIAREPRISRPRFAGTAPDGAIVAFSAEEMRPDPTDPQGFVISSVRASLDALDGTRFEITAGEGGVNARESLLRLDSLARLTVSGGYVMETAGLRAWLDSGRIETTGPMEMRAPFGRISADQMIIAPSEAGEGRQMVFNGDVRLLYLPEEQER